MLLETGAPANALPQKAAEMGLRGFSVRAAINYKTRERECPRGMPDKGQQSLTGGNMPLLGDENVNTGKESQYLKTLRKGKGFFPIFVFSIDFRDWEKLHAYFKVIVPGRIRARGTSDYSVFWQPNHCFLKTILKDPHEWLQS